MIYFGIYLLLGVMYTIIFFTPEREATMLEMSKRQLGDDMGQSLFPYLLVFMFILTILIYPMGLFRGLRNVLFHNKPFFYHKDKEGREYY